MRRTHGTVRRFGLECRGSCRSSDARTSSVDGLTVDWHGHVDDGASSWAFESLLRCRLAVARCGLHRTRASVALLVGWTWLVQVWVRRSRIGCGGRLLEFSGFG